mmetsp:Transcript_26695/g.37834  ORF Transcript_26695/g.37834 Transcript_26695/m.37834 type:complete len:252 (-) Transcript_26695:64-819(-)
MDSLKVSVPAFLYVVQNMMLYVALSNLTAPFFQVVYQFKLVTTAFVSVLLLERKYSLKQWICLIVLSVGVATVVTGEHEKGEKSKQKINQSTAIGLAAVSTACFSSAIAGVYFEKIISQCWIRRWIRNIQLSFSSAILALLQNSLSRQNEVDLRKSFFHGFTVWVMVLVVLQAGGGLLVAAVMKYTDNVLKGLATGVSVVVGTAFSTVLFKTPLTSQFVIGSFIILLSVYLFNSNALVSYGGEKEVGSNQS